MVVAVQRIGTATATVAVIFGQLAMSLLIDNFGWLGNDAITFSAGRLGAIVCLGLALFFIYRSSTAAKAEDKDRPPTCSGELSRIANRGHTVRHHVTGALDRSLSGSMVAAAARLGITSLYGDTLCLRFRRC
jgi:hypothetical protein